MNDQHTRPSIVAVLDRHGLEVVERTGWRPVRCPYHDDSTASASVNTDLGAFTCHACGVKGDVYKLLMYREGITFPEALVLGDSLAADPNATDHKTGRVAGTKRGYKPPGRRGRK